MGEWVISPWGGVAYLDLRGEELTFSEAERLIEVVRPLFQDRRLARIIIDVRDLDFLPGPVEFLFEGAEALEPAQTPTTSGSRSGGTKPRSDAA
jgi:hypothetical protein